MFGRYTVILLLFSCAALANSEKDKSSHSLFDPVPKERMRDFSTDRPDKTESPYTVDAGHIQIETDFVFYTHDQEESFGIMVSNLKIGLTNSIDLQTILSPLNIKNRQSGFGDTIFRLKVNLMGNDDGAVGLGLMPFVKAPTNSNGLGNKNVEGGLIFPIALSLPKNLSLGFMLQANRNKNRSDDRFHSEFISTVTLAREFFQNFGGYVEFFSLSSSEATSAWISTFDVGLTYEVIPNLQFDAGVNLGLTDEADDLNPFLGVSVRF